MAAKKGRKPAITNVARPEGFVDDLFGPLGKKAVSRVTKMAENAARAARQTDKDFARYQRTGSAYSTAKEGAKRRLLAEEVIAAQRGISLKDARKLIAETPVGNKSRSLMKDTDKAIGESRKVLEAREKARKARRAAKRNVR